VIRLERNGKLVLKMRSEETPWFFYSDDLIESRRRHGDVVTAVDILRWFTHPIDEMLNALKARAPRSCGRQAPSPEADKGRDGR
jgi:hypothetical protein